MALSAATRERIRNEFPAFAYLMNHPDIANTLGRAIEEGWDPGKLQANLMATGWWKRHGESARAWDTIVGTDPATAARQRKGKWYEVELEAGRLGVTLTAAQRIQIGEGALRNQWSEAEMRRAILQYGKPGKYAAGQVRVSQQEIIAMAKEFATPLAHSVAWNWSRRIAEGSMTMDAVRSELVNQAGWRFASHTGITRALQQGQSVRDFMAPVIGRVAEELGINPDSFDLTTGWGKELVNHKDSETGDFRVMNDTEAIQWARGQRQWRDTGNARQLSTQLSQAITEKMGVRKG
jgi:hypothetical protein